MAPPRPDSSQRTPAKREHSSSDNDKPSPKRQPRQTEAVQGQELQAQPSDTGTGPMRDLVTTSKGTAEGRLEQERDPGSTLTDLDAVQIKKDVQEYLKRIEQLDEQCAAQEEALAASKTIREGVETEYRQLKQELEKKELEEKGHQNEDTSSRSTSSMEIDLQAATNARDLLNRVRTVEENHRDKFKNFIKANVYNTRFNAKDIRGLKARMERASDIQESLQRDLSESANHKVNELMTLLTVTWLDAKRGIEITNKVKSRTYEHLGSAAFTIPMFETFRDTMPRWFRQRLEDMDEGSLITEDAIISQKYWALEAKIPVEAVYVHMMINEETFRKQDCSDELLMAWLSVNFIVEWKARLENDPEDANETLASRIADTGTWFGNATNEEWRKDILKARDLVEKDIGDKAVDTSWRRIFHSGYRWAYMYTLAKAQQSKSASRLDTKPLGAREIWPFWKAIVNDDCMSIQGLMENWKKNVRWGEFARIEDGTEE